MKTLRICIGSACHLKGSYEVIEIFQQLIKEKELNDFIELKAAFCLGHVLKQFLLNAGMEKYYRFLRIMHMKYSKSILWQSYGRRKMGVINFSKANCKNCYSCVRACPVKAVRVKNEQAEIMEERCIICGRCLKVCPKNAKEIESELKVVKEFLQEDNEVAVSIAPSFVAAYGSLSNKICAGLKKLGFTYVEETAIGAKIITDKYMEYACKTDEKAYITSCCPSVNEFIEKHYPELVSNLIPIISPMQCHGKIIKKKYGIKTRVIFIGPCLAKKAEAKEENNIDAVLTFEELSRWFNDSKIKLENLEEIPFDTMMGTMKRYPMAGGVTHTLKDKNISRQIIHVDGVEDCHDILKAIKDGKFKNALIEMSLCRHGCINGPAMPENDITVHERRQWVEKYAINCEKYNKHTFEFEFRSKY